MFEGDDSPSFPHAIDRVRITNQKTNGAQSVGVPTDEEPQRPGYLYRAEVYADTGI